jgi:hypothetical protein
MYKLPDDQWGRFFAMLSASEIEDLRETAACKQILAEGQAAMLTEWRERTAAIILRLLRHRFRILEASVELRIKALLLEDLETLGEDLLDFSSTADLTVWLQRRQ